MCVMPEIVEVMDLVAREESVDEYWFLNRSLASRLTLACMDTRPSVTVRIGP